MLTRPLLCRAGGTEAPRRPPGSASRVSALQDEEGACSWDPGRCTPPSQLPTLSWLQIKTFSVPGGSACLWGPSEGPEAGRDVGAGVGPPACREEDPRSVPGQVWEGELQPQRRITTRQLVQTALGGFLVFSIRFRDSDGIHEAVSFGDERQGSDSPEHRGCWAGRVGAALGTAWPGAGVVGPGTGEPDGQV